MAKVLHRTIGAIAGVGILNAGTIGGAKTYYRIVLSQNYNISTSAGYYKSGRRTGCCTFTFLGIGCQGGGNEEEIVE